MKPTEIQIEVAKLVERQARFWQNTNDIKSPTHCCDIDEELNNLALDYPELTDDKLDDISKSLQDLYFSIRQLNT